MIEIQYAAQITKLVVFEGMTFRSAIDEIFPQERKNFVSSNISLSLAFHAIRHYYLFENILVSSGLDLSKNIKSMIYVVLANNFYKKIIPSNSANGFIKGIVGEEDYRVLLPILKRTQPLEALITFEKNTDSYFATKYNIPHWVIHMWRRQYGDKQTIEFLESMMKIGFQSYSVNTLKTSTDELLKKYPEFSSPFENLVVYEGMKRFFNTKEYLNDEYFLLKVAYKCILEDLVDKNEEVLLFSAFNDGIVKELVANSGGEQSINIAVPKLDKRLEVMRFLRKSGLRNINLFEANDIFSLKAGLSYQVEKVIVYPDSTHFDLASTYPDYLFHVDQDKLDETIKKEAENLELCSNAVMEGGTLVYIVDTLNKKESEQIIADFLSKHPEFSCVSKQQYLPSHPFSTLFYYAVLEKGVAND